MSSPFVGMAITPANTDLDLMAQVASNADGTARAAVATATSAMASVSALLSSGRIPFIWAGDYGVVGDGSTDDTVKMQAALTAGSTLNRAVYCGQLAIKITGPLTMSGPGLFFDRVSHGDEYIGTPASAPPGILITGTAYTALTVTGRPQYFAAAFYGTGQSVDGVAFGTVGNDDPNVALARVQHVRVYKLAGFGVQLNKTWDSVYETISIEQCGINAANKEAFSIRGGMSGGNPDTSNMTHIMRLQVEKALGRAIYIDGSTLSCLIDDIHSEQATAVASVNTWYLGSSRTTYHAGRFSALAPAANATLFLAGGDAVYESFLVEGAIDVAVDAGSASSVVTIINPEIQGTFHLVNGQAGTAVVIGGQLASVYDPTLGTGTVVPGLKCFGVGIGSLTLGFQSNFDPTLATFTNCSVAVLACTSTHASALFFGGTVGTAAGTIGNLAVAGVIKFFGTEILGTGTMTFTGAQLWMSDCIFHPGLTLGDSIFVRMSATHILGDMTGTALRDILMDSQCTVGAGSTNVGIPTSAPHVLGDTHWDPLPVALGSPGWRCTTAGNPGTFTPINSIAALPNALTAGTYLTSGGTYNGSVARTFAVDATDANTANKVVARNASGNFSAGTITANITGNVSGSAATVTGASQSAITSVGALTALAMAAGGDINVGNNFVAGAVVPTGYILLKDLGGTLYKVIVGAYP